ncbi:MAG: hypothetical protein ACRD8Z_14240 [Nitrososphaeraceae archaeon]
MVKHGNTKKSKGKHRIRSRQRPENEISEDDINFFVHSLEERLESGVYPKLRELEKMLKPRLSSQKIITVLGYLQRSKMIEVDLDGNIIWVRRDTSVSAEGSTLFDSASMSEDFRKLLQNHNRTQ